MFTNKRIIIIDRQGITRKKIETYSIPYNTIEVFSVENIGILDISSEVELWTKIGRIKLRFKRDFDIKLINKVLSNAILNK